jgi:hypothetical protein
VKQASLPAPFRRHPTRRRLGQPPPIPRYLFDAIKQQISPIQPTTGLIAVTPQALKRTGMLL